MANHKSAAKRARQAVRRTAVNSRRQSTVRTWEKKLRTAIAENEKSKAVELLSAFNSQISKAVRAGLVHANAASRKIGRLAAQVSRLA